MQYSRFDLNMRTVGAKKGSKERERPELVSNRTAAAMSHPTRMYAMSVFWVREASPREIAAEIDEPINNVTYHVKQLLDLGWIELVDQRPAGGGRVVEHFYQAIRSTRIDDADWEQVGEEERRVLDQAIINMMSRDLSEALLSGSFFEVLDNYLTRIPIEVDAEGWEESKAILRQAFDELMAVRETVANRVAESGEPTRPTKVAIIQFYSPEPGGESS